MSKVYDSSDKHPAGIKAIYAVYSLINGRWHHVDYAENRQRLAWSLKWFRSIGRKVKYRKLRSPHERHESENA